jgi:basic membrane lipoprotein Med (substrate-binding protein (PBP1-ABC) superfamily)
VALAAAALSGAACSLVAQGHVSGKGIGASCAENTDCHAGFCDRGICAATCTHDTDCPSPTGCFGNACRTPLHVAALYIGVIANGEGWTLTHHLGLQEAARQLPQISWDPSTPFIYRENVVGLGPDGQSLVTSTIEDDVARGADVVVANSLSQRTEVVAAAAQHPDTKFLIASAFTSGPNLGSFDAHTEQAWLIAGRLAARKSTTKRIGIIGSYVTPEVVREINAFALGARRERSDVVTEVQWIGFWYDYADRPQYPYPPGSATPTLLYREELLAQRLLDSGCDVIAHTGDNQRSVRYVDRLTASGEQPDTVFSMSNDTKDGCKDLASGQPIPSCIGGAYLNWGPLYTRLFDQIVHSTWQPSAYDVIDPMTVDPDLSVVGFALNPVSSIGIDDSSVRGMINDVVQAGPDAVFAGPYETTGQRDKNGLGTYDTIQEVASGETLTPQEWSTMCWFVRGIVEKTVRDDPKSPDRPALVPDVPAVARTPRANETMAWPDLLIPPGLSAADGQRPGLDCRENR